MTKTTITPLKGIHSSDHHLTIKRGKKTVSYTFENQTIEFNAYSDYLYRKFEALIDYAVSKKLDFFVSAGDIFHTVNVQKYEIDRLLKSIKKLADA
jgi:DNA repair exonuclease SbcCD nuclease subunit